MVDMPYEDFIRSRITELRMALPSLKELFNIIAYFNMTPAEFFAPLEDDDSTYHKLCEQLRTLSDEDLDKVATFINWITK